MSGDSYDVGLDSYTFLLNRTCLAILRGFGNLYEVANRGVCLVKRGFEF